MREIVLATLVVALAGGIACKDRQSPGGGSGGSGGGGRTEQGRGYGSERPKGSGVASASGGAGSTGGNVGKGPGSSAASGPGSGKSRDDHLKDATLIGTVGAKVGVLKMLTLRMEADNGKITLGGSVASAKDKADVEAAVRTTPGVASLVSELKVAQ